MYNSPHNRTMVYAVRKGRTPGVYETWAECKAQIEKFPGAIFKKFSDAQDAQKFLMQESAPTPLKKRKAEESKIPIELTEWNATNIFTDGGQNAQTGSEEAWGCVTNGQGKCIIGSYLSLCLDMNVEEKVLPVGKRWCIRAKFENVQQQNNGAELLALVVGLRIALTSPHITTIHTDSDLLVKYWSKGICNQTTLDPKKLAYIVELTDLRNQFEARSGAIMKIAGNINPADLGCHK